MFRVGQKVVCVDASPPRCGTNRRPLTLGAIYTITGIDDEHPNGIFGLILAEDQLVRHPRWRCPLGWCQSRFRPLIEKSTDAGMAILKEILERETISDRAPARQSS